MPTVFFKDSFSKTIETNPVLRQMFMELYSQKSNELQKYTDIQKLNYIVTRYTTFNISKYLKESINLPFSSLPSLTVKQFLKLLNDMIILHFNSFRVNYAQTCPKGQTDFDMNIIDRNIDILNNPILNIDNLYIVYSFDNDIPKIIFMASYIIDPQNNNFLYVYNVCSHTKNTIKAGLKTTEIFKTMTDDFLKLNQNVKYMCLFIEENNPSFSKAFSLYYKNKFMPVINKLDIQENILERMLGCYNYADLPYDNCLFQTTTKMLMIYSIGNLFEYYPKYLFEKSVQLNSVKRGNNFIDPIIAFSHRCQCILDKFFDENIIHCNNILQEYHNFFEINQGENKNVINSDNNLNYYDAMEYYLKEAKKNSFLTITSRQDIFRLIGTYFKNNKSILRLNKYFNNKNDTNYIHSKKRISKKRITLVLKELKSGNFDFSINLIEMMTDITHTTDIKNKSGIDIQDIIDNQIKNFIGSFKDTVKDLGMRQDDKFLFIPSGFSFQSDIDPNKNVNHAVSFIFDKDNKTLFFYDSWKIYKDYDILQQISIGFLAKCTKEIITQNKDSNNQNYIIREEYILDKYLDGNNEYYCKIQQVFADDTQENLCVLLSLVPYICLMMIDDSDPSKTLKQLQFYMWFLFYSSIIFRQKKEYGNVKEMEIFNSDYGSNILIIFPYFYISIYSVIKNILIDKTKQQLMITNEDKKILSIIHSSSEELFKNIIRINQRINETINDKLEIPYKYF
jgi:hypothetical protein